MPASSATTTLALALGLGVLITLASHKMRIPALIPLMVAGAALGGDGLGLVDPSLLGGGLNALITLSVAILIFEGSLHLDPETLAHSPRAVRGLLTIGALVTWAGVCAAGMLLLGLPLPLATVLGAILIVTGPTVIQPLLQRVRLTPRLHASLLSEGILIDPIGVIATVATLEIVLTARVMEATPGAWQLVWLYVGPFVSGGAVGAAVGLVTRWLLARTLGYGHEGDRTVALLAIAASLVGAGISELIWHESGLVATAVAGVIIARSLKRQLHAARRAAEGLAQVLVGLLFILLAATFDLRALASVSWREAAFVGAVMLVVRPLSVLASTPGSKLSWRERAYLALMAPRGIVAVSAAALAASALSGSTEGAEESGGSVQRPVLLVVVVTVLWAGLAGGLLATLLRVRGKAGTGIIIAGAGRLGREVALIMRGENIPVRLVDTNQTNCAIAKVLGLDAMAGDATDADWMAHEVAAPEHANLISMTGNPDVDKVVARWGAAQFGPTRGVALAELLPAGAATSGRASGAARNPALEILDRVETGQFVVRAAPPATPRRVALLALKGGRIVPVAGGIPDDVDVVVGIHDAGNGVT